MRKKKTSPIIEKLYEYDDYRAFLQDFIADQKSNHKGFTLSAFSKKAGFSSHGFLRFILNGERNLSDKSLLKIVTAINLKGNKKEFFCSLVAYNQSVKSADKTLFFDKVKQFRKVIKSNTLNEEFSKFYENWYYPVVKELAVSTLWGGDFRKLGKMLSPSITFFQAKEAIEYLIEMGLIEKSDSGTYSTGKEHVNSHEVPIYAKKGARREVLQMGVEAVDKFSLDERYTAYTTLSLDDEAYNDIQDMYNEMREKIIKRADESSNGDVYEAVLQLFPVSRINKKDLKANQK